MNITVYCSSRDDLDSRYTDTARIAGEVIGQNNSRLIYGGVNAGMMHITAVAAAENGAEITGYIPEFFSHRADPLLNETVLTSSLSERKQKMLEDADLFVVLPGGLGTIDEWMSTMAHLEVTKDTRRKIIVVNINGMYDNILHQLETTAYSKFARSDNFLNINIVVDNAKDFELVLNSRIQNYGKE